MNDVKYGEVKEYALRDKVRVRDRGIGNIVKCDSFTKVPIYKIRITDPAGTYSRIDETVAAVVADMALVEKAPEAES